MTGKVRVHHTITSSLRSNSQLFAESFIVTLSVSLVDVFQPSILNICHLIVSMKF
ncbi:hypothetical protein BDV34DRAFT_183143 [Aspergillus parasiticus]|uniref:Uncharacterized protein n=1 Tax=Aspergillus parasiticus TaxID=5067 RepID=A0A5N6D9S1_ASPPA|nr:hypothetical protein BDV34DRAFT_183143 [Aspergillus parasiticus]